MTARKAWPEDMGAAEYHQMLGAARRIAHLAEGIIEYCIPVHNAALLDVWLDRIHAKGLEIKNARAAIWRNRTTEQCKRLPDWVLEALETIGNDSREAVELAESAQRHLARDNWEVLRVEAARLQELGLLMEGCLLAGPGPGDGVADVLDQVRELVETLEE